MKLCNEVPKPLRLLNFRQTQFWNMVAYVNIPRTKYNNDIKGSRSSYVCTYSTIPLNYWTYAFP